MTFLRNILNGPPSSEDTDFNKTMKLRQARASNLEEISNAICDHKFEESNAYVVVEDKSKGLTPDAATIIEIIYRAIGDDCRPVNREQYSQAVDAIKNTMKESSAKPTTFKSTRALYDQISKKLSRKDKELIKFYDQNDTPEQVQNRPPSL